MEKVHKILVGTANLYEVVEHEDGVSMSLRETENHEHKVRLLKSVLPTLIKKLQAISS